MANIPLKVIERKSLSSVTTFDYLGHRNIVLFAQSYNHTIELLNFVIGATS